MAINTTLRNEALKLHYEQKKAELEQVNIEYAAAEVRLASLAEKKTALETAIAEYEKPDYDAIVRPVAVIEAVEPIKEV